MGIPGDLQAIVDRFKRMNATAEVRTGAAHAAALREAQELAAQMGRMDRTLRRVVLFGSALPGGRFRLDSDIDLAVEGGDRALLERLATGVDRRVDIVGLDDLREGIREWVLSEGVVLYAADTR